MSSSSASSCDTTSRVLLTHLHDLDTFKAKLRMRYGRTKGHELDGANVYTNYRRVDDEGATWATATIADEGGIRKAIEGLGNTVWAWHNQCAPAKCQAYWWCELLIVVFAGKGGRASFLAYTTSMKLAGESALDEEDLMPMPQYMAFENTCFTPLPSSSSSSAPAPATQVH